MMDGLKNGILTEARLDEAVTRILALKASLGLPEKLAAGTMIPGPEALEIFRDETHRNWARECADKAVTLVKDTQHILPLDSRNTKGCCCMYLAMLAVTMIPQKIMQSALSNSWRSAGLRSPCSTAQSRICSISAPALRA